jgi:hypothetical protein
MEMYGSCQVCNELYILLTHPLSDTAQAHLSRLAWYVVFCDVPNDGVLNMNTGKDHHRHDRLRTRW